MGVVGGGIAGLTTAYLLSKEGQKVVVLEDGELASGESGRTTGHLSNALDDGYTTLKQIQGQCTGACSDACALNAKPL